ncbi:uncharacterized protein CDV56_102175 [Aspergillus thermomutatus]|uniref:Uncharacterized protein n=1 Tax=Aspergillus thermomutatus TaxID=41047 RepID=A0A397G0X4_ASPTH|nr:uncharacterized protein CDV56_102175 [Aspergillus thermomutatus]RHZ43474.1 hypothetical protein CDV56_102175 [Aspergillus thermomutatus]
MPKATPGEAEGPEAGTCEETRHPSCTPAVANVLSHTKAKANAPERKSQRVWNRAYDELASDEAATDLQSIKSDVHGKDLLFSDDGRYLKTSQRLYTLASGVLAPSPDPELSRSVLYNAPAWVMRGDQKLL